MENTVVRPSDYRVVTSNFEFKELYPWQRQALQAWKDHNFKGVVEAVTGAGKTRVGIAAVAQALRLGMKVTILVPTTELQEQWMKSLQKDLAKASVGRLGGNSNATFQEYDVIVAIINSAATRSVIEHFRSGLVVADECHRYAAPLFANALEETYEWRLGLTATYTREDGRNDILDDYFGRIVYRIWYDQAQQSGVISEFDIALVGIHLLPEERMEYERLSEKISEDTLSLRNYIDLGDHHEHDFMEAVVALSQVEDESAASAIARRYLSNVSERQTILATTPVKNHALAAIAPAIAASERGLVFGSSKEQAKTATQTLEAVGLAAGYLMSGMTKVERLGTMNAFRRGELHVLSAPRVLDEGIDVPAADLAVQTSGTRVQRQFIQRLGRVIRKRTSGDRGRFVYLYAFGTVEDPAWHREFLPDVLPFARDYMFFDLEKHIEDLLEFLAPEQVGAVVEPPGSSPQGEVQIDTVIDTEPEQTVVSWNDIPEDDGDEIPERLLGVGLPTDPVGDYLTKISQYPLLNSEEMIELAEQVEAGLYATHVLATDFTSSRKERRDLWKIEDQGNVAYQRMLNSNLRLVVSIAKRYRRSHEEPAFAFLDIVQEGNIGLTRAVELWDYKKGYKFSTYATNWIRQAITRSITDSSRTIRIPVHVDEKLNQIRRVEQEIRSHGAEITVARIAAEMKETPEKIQDLLDSVATIVSLSSERWIDRQPYSLADVIVDYMTLEGGDLVIEQIYRGEMRDALETATLEWTEREQKILFKRWGLTTFDGKMATLEEVGREHGITRERVRQLQIQLEERLVDDDWLKSAWYPCYVEREPALDSPESPETSG